MYHLTSLAQHQAMINQMLGVILIAAEDMGFLSPTKQQYAGSTASHNLLQV
jgi:hypothetical protein